MCPMMQRYGNTRLPVISNSKQSRTPGRCTSVCAVELAYIPVSSRSSSGNLGTTVKNNYNSNTAAGYDTAAEGRQRIRSSPFSAWITADAGPSRIPAGNRLGKRDPASRGKEGGEARATAILLSTLCCTCYTTSWCDIRGNITCQPRNAVSSSNNSS